MKHHRYYAWMFGTTPVTKHLKLFNANELSRI